MNNLYFFFVSIVLLLTACGISSKSNSEKSKDYLEESDRFIFYSNFWLNQHHFLYNKTLIYKEKGIGEAIDQSVWEGMQSAEKEQLLASFRFYQDSLIEHDLRTGEVHFYFKKWCIDFSEKEMLPKYAGSDSLHFYLNLAKPVYEKYFWPDHKAANFSVLKDNLSLIKKYENKAVKRLTELTKNEWTNEKIRVDISYHSKLERPYTTTHGGVHMVMDAGNNHSPPGNWLELLFHESSHHLIKSRDCYVSDVIDKVAKDIGLKPPRGLWHAYLFYFTGVVTKDYLVKEGLTDYELYMVRKRPFHWVFPMMDAHLPAYISGTASLEEVPREIIKDWHAKEND